MGHEAQLCCAVDEARSPYPKCQAASAKRRLAAAGGLGGNPPEQHRQGDGGQLQATRLHGYIRPSCMAPPLRSTIWGVTSA